MAASNDLGAIQAWLAEFHDSPPQTRNLSQGGRRLLLWALLEQGKPLSSLTREDCLQVNFSSPIHSRVSWCGTKAPRFSPRWRPFLGPLGPASCKLAMLIINSLFSYLVKAGWPATPGAGPASHSRSSTFAPSGTVPRTRSVASPAAAVADLPRDSERDQ